MYFFYRCYLLKLISRNIAGEGIAYLQFITTYYEHLPKRSNFHLERFCPTYFSIRDQLHTFSFLHFSLSRMLFLHSHRIAYHQEDIMVGTHSLDSFSSIFDIHMGFVQILLANLSPEVEYCNVNRVAWGFKEVTHSSTSFPLVNYHLVCVRIRCIRGSSTAGHKIMSFLKASILTRALSMTPLEVG